MWKVDETGKVDDALIDRLGSSFLAGNGYLGVRGTLEEFGREEKAAVIINGLYDKVGTKWREPISAPSALGFKVTCEGESLDARKGKHSLHTQSLDFRHGLQERVTLFKTSKGTEVGVRSRRFVSAVHERLIV